METPCLLSVCPIGRKRVGQKHRKIGREATDMVYMNRARSETLVEGALMSSHTRSCRFVPNYIITIYPCYFYSQNGHIFYRDGEAAFILTFIDRAIAPSVERT